MDKIEKMRQEIERRRLHFNKEAEKYQALNKGYSQNCYGARDALRDLENFLDTLSEEPDKDLEEAADNFAHGYDQGTCDGIAQECFIAGAELQRQKDRGEFAKIKAKTWCEGFDACKEQMMKGAVEGEVVTATWDDYCQGGVCKLKIGWNPQTKPSYKKGDKIKVIVIKED